MRKLMIAAALATATAAAPAIAQNNGGSGLVAVNVQDVDILKNFLNNSQVSVLDNVSAPITVQVPVGIAANVCGVAVNALVADLKQDGKATCDAKNGSQALSQAAIRQLATQKK